MNIGRMKISDLRFAEYNPRVVLKPGMEEYDKIKRNILEFGFIEPIVVNDRTGNIVGGHQRINVLKDIGYDEVDVVHVDLDLDHEKALNIALNKITGKWDNDKLIKLVDSLDLGDVQFTGFGDIELSGIRASLDDIPTFSLDLVSGETNSDDEDNNDDTEEYDAECCGDGVDNDDAEGVDSVYSGNDANAENDVDIEDKDCVDIEDENSGDSNEDVDIDNPDDIVMVKGETSNNWVVQITDYKNNVDDIKDVLSSMGFDLKISKATSTLIDGDLLNIEEE